MIHRQWFEPAPGAATGPAGSGDTAALVLLHEGLGSISAWGPFPQQLADGTGRRVLAFDRRGYGRSEAHPGPWPARYMHDEAARLPALLAEEGVGDGLVLVGHSDGASIALLYPSQAAPGSPRPAGIVSLSAHLFVEPVGVAAIAEVTAGYESTGLRDRLARHHADADATFGAWSDVWLSDRFRPWVLDDDVGAAPARCWPSRGRPTVTAPGSSSTDWPPPWPDRSTSTSSTASTTGPPARPPTPSSPSSPPSWRN